jgi:dihydroorotate dehydrogenase (fumarate)
MDLTTTYLGLELPHPLMPGASPIATDLDLVKRYEDAGAAALVMHSLFEEQIVNEQLVTHAAFEFHAESFPEALSYLPEHPRFSLGPDSYLDHLRRIKETVDIPVIASLNGTTSGGWLRYAGLMEEAGADALELNVYFLGADPSESAELVENRMINMVREVRESVRIPLAVKLSHSFTSLAHTATRLSGTGADGLVLFNRFYQPDIDIESLEVVRSLRLSVSAELLFRLRWLAILSGRVTADLAVSGGVHTATDAIKAVMAGAHAVQMVSALLKNGPDHLPLVRGEMAAWLEEHEYDSLRQMQGSMSLERCPDPKAYERANYIQVLSGWKGLT